MMFDHIYKYRGQPTQQLLKSLQISGGFTAIKNRLVKEIKYDEIRILATGHNWPCCGNQGHSLGLDGGLQSYKYFCDKNFERCRKRRPSRIPVSLSLHIWVSFKHKYVFLEWRWANWCSICEEIHQGDYELGTSCTRGEYATQYTTKYNVNCAAKFIKLKI